MPIARSSWPRPTRAATPTNRPASVRRPGWVREWPTARMEAVMELGFKLCSEERRARDLVADAWRAEEAGFGFVAASDHFHPWLASEGESPAVWPVLGAVAANTTGVGLGTFVSCPTMRQHPALVAQAAATVAELAPGRMFLGLGTGERLNEHITHDEWPETSVRRAMLG